MHLLLAEGAHNQFGDLPWTARVEMLIQQWLLARPEMRDFLQSRPMVPYKEPWMGEVDTMKTLQGWTDVTVTHFRDLAVFGEQILLSIRYGDWIDINDAGVGEELGALLAAGNPGLHPCLSGRDGCRPDSRKPWIPRCRPCIS